MHLAHLVIHAAVQAFADVLGMSGAAHAHALGLWLPAPPQAPLAGAVGLGAVAAVVTLERATLSSAMPDGVRALARPFLFYGSAKAREAAVLFWLWAVSIGVTLVLNRAGPTVAPTPRAVAAGLCATGVALAAGLYVAALRAQAKPPVAKGPARHPARVELDVRLLAGLTATGVVHAFGVWPGVSRVGMALAMLVAIGLKPARALGIALLVTVPFWGASFVSAFREYAPFGRGHLLLATVLGFAGAGAAVLVLRLLVARGKLLLLCAWTIPLACALFAYGRAAPPPPSPSAATEQKIP